ncbi:GDSL-type esterase/lipase family protein [Paenibacillus alkalitolerans]|uniref:GDSL-type esterase/lipase family protein n=1 Tax=Paenibacillus alkalitolerans TaxID=2799335 RepID=UPI0018F3B19A|nr:GDSL-type esterase/lipase family protein [Paenibacillus alkalitolerans]
MADLVARALAAKLKPVTGCKVIGLGDSITQADTDLPNNSFGDSSWFMQLIARSNGRLRYVRNSGISGNTTAMMLSRLQTDVIAHKPDMCVILGGTNDVGGDVVTSTTIGNLEAMIKMLLAANITPIIGTMPPRGDTLKDTLLVQTNTAIKDLAYRYKLILLDFHSVLVDPANGNFKAGYAGDNLHPTSVGSKVMAEYAFEKISPFLPYAETLLPDWNNDPHNMLANGLFITDGDSNGVPDSWISYGSSSVTTSLVDNANIVGKAAKMTATSNASGNRYLEQTISDTNKFAVGDKIAFCGKFIAEMTNDVDVIYGAGVAFTGGTPGLTPLKDWEVKVDNGRFYHEVTVPSGTTAIVTRFSVGNGTGSAYWGQVGLYNLTKMGLA